MATTTIFMNAPGWGQRTWDARIDEGGDGVVVDVHVDAIADCGWRPRGGGDGEAARVGGGCCRRRCGRCPKASYCAALTLLPAGDAELGHHGAKGGLETLGTQQDSGSGRSRSRHGDGPYRSNAGDVPFAVDGGGSSGPVAVCVMWAASCGELPYHLLDPRRRRRRRPCAATREGRPMAPLLREHLKRRCRRRLRRWVWWAWAQISF